MAVKQGKCHYSTAKGGSHNGCQLPDTHEHWLLLFKGYHWLYSATRLLDQARLDIERLDSALADYQTHEKQIAAINASLPKTYEHYAQHIRAIEKSATDNKLDLTLSLDPKTVAESTSLTSLRLGIEAKRQLSKPGKLFSCIAKMPIHTRVDMLSISGEPAQNATIIMRLYGQP
jgi:hypothetical protein